MGVPFLVYLLAVTFLLPLSIAETNSTTDSRALIALRKQWDNTPPNWTGNDPCHQGWVGIHCNNESRVTAIILSGLNVRGSLPTHIFPLSELVTLDLSNNPGLTGMLPQDIGNLKNLVNLVLVGCNFSGSIPESIGSMSKLSHLFLNSNHFNGTIPHSFGNLSSVTWLDVSNNHLTGSLPVSNETASGLDRLLNAKHFHLGNNQLSGEIPQELFRSGMKLVHLILDHNRLSGSIPETLGHVRTLEVIRLDNNSINQSVPENLNNLIKLKELYLSNNLLTGSMPNLTALTSLTYIDLSNNNFDASEIPSWFSTLPKVTTIILKNTNLQGKVPDRFNLNLQTVILRHNNLSGVLGIGKNYGSSLRMIDLQYNSIVGYVSTTYNKFLLLQGNPVCDKNEAQARFCIAGHRNYKTYKPEKNCTSVSCSSNQLPWPDYKCSIPYIGSMMFLSFSFSDLNDTANYFTPLANNLVNEARSLKVPIDSVSLITSTIDTYGYLNLTIAFCPSVEEKFNLTGICSIGNYLNNQIFSPPAMFGPFSYISQPQESDIYAVNKGTKITIIVGVTVSIILLILLVLTGVYAYHQRKIAQEAAKRNNPFASWDPSKGGGDIPQINEARWFSFDDMKRCTNDFSEVNEIGCGGYGMVYSGTLPGGRLVAIKRAQRGSLQGAFEFKTEIELLSRVHHKNIVNLVGFCYDKGEQMLIYEYMAGGNLGNIILGKSKIRLDWTGRLTIALGAARGLAYLHNFADPPIIHRDVKSNNILLDDHLNAKVSDFGLSKLVNHPEKYNETTDVKGTLGYLDPDYFTTQIVTEKSDVYSFGVILLELLTGKRPIEMRMHIVRYVREKMNQTTDLQSLVDPSIDSDLSMSGLKEFLNLAMRCVEESSVDRPTMGEVVQELEKIMQVAGLNTTTEMRLTSAVSLEVMSEGSTYASTDYAYLNHGGGTLLR